MIAIFTWINTSKQFDIREFNLKDWIPSNYRWLSTEKYYSEDLPKFKSLSSCENRNEYNRQFQYYNTNQLTLC